MRFEGRSQQIKLFGKSFRISEKSVRDTLAASREIDALTLSGVSQDEALIAATAICVSAGLAINIRRLPKWRWRKRAKLRRLFDASNLMNNLSVDRLLELNGIMTKLEGREPSKNGSAVSDDEKKKVMDAISASHTQTQ